MPEITTEPVFVEPDPAAPEIPLAGGDVTEGVVRVGGTVRRPLGAHSPLVHALLRHLESVGFEGAPRFLGIDGAGREVLTFIEGEVAGDPRPAWVADEARLASVGRLVRAYDDAVTGFTVPEGVDVSGGFAETPDMPPAPSYPAELVGHMDFTSTNIVFRDGAAYALFDFDIAKPVARVDEVLNAMLWWAPLLDPVDRDEPLREVDSVRRCRILADAYGMSDADRRRLVEVALLRTRRSWFAMRHNAETKGGGWARMWADGVGDAIKRREAWLDRHGAAIEAALTA
jgi:hypothetical protein